MAATDLIGRLGATSFELRYSEPETPEGETVWMAIAQFKTGWDAGAGQSPLHSAHWLLDQLVDGGQCTHCSRPSGVDHGFSPMPLADAVCWYQYDPELRKYRRGCEGD